MAEPHRVLRVAKWAGLALVVALAATWALSFRFNAVWNCSPGFLGVTNGGLQGKWPAESNMIMRFDKPGVFYAPRSKVVWLPSIINGPFFAGAGGTHWTVEIPFWLLLLAVAFPTALVWRRDRRIPPGHCSKCGYDLTGNVSGRCPECGKAV